MSYLPNKNRKTKRIVGTIVGLGIVLALFVYTPLLSALGRPGVRVAAFFTRIGHKTTSVVHATGDYFRSKRSLGVENRILSEQLIEAKIRLRGKDLLSAENTALKALMGRISETTFLLAAVLAKPNHSPYDTLLVDVGESDQVRIGDEVFAGGTILIGRVSDVYGTQSKVKLFSTSGEETSVRFSGSGVDFILRGRGGGAFEILVPKDFPVEVGENVFVPGLSATVVAEVVKVADDSHNASKTVYLRVPVNIFELNWIQIKRHAR